MKSKMRLPYLEVHNEEDFDIALLIEPHLEQYIILPGQKCDLYYLYLPDNLIPEKTLSVAYRPKEIVVYSHGEFAPRVEIDGKLVEPQIA